MNIIRNEKTMRLLIVSMITALVIFLCMLSCSEKGNNNPVGPGSYKTCKVTGKVVTLRDLGWEELGGVTVEISGDSLFHKTTVTEESGDYSFAGLLKGDYTLKAYIDKFVIGPGEMHITIRDSIVVVDDFIAVGLSEGEWGRLDEFIIAGKVTNNNNMPVFGVKVIIRGTNTFSSPHSDGMGFFEYWRAKEGETYSLVPEKKGYDYIFTPDTCYVTLDEHLEICNFSAVNIGEPLHSISGRVVNSEGIGINNFKVDLYSSGHLISKTDRQGFYHFYDLKDGIYTIFFPLNTPKVETDSLVIEIQGEDVMIPDVRTYNDTTNFKVKGRVVDSDGKAISDVTVNVYNVELYRTYLEHELKTGTNGTFSCEVFVHRNATKNTFRFIPQKDGFLFTPDSTEVTLQWIEFESQGEDVTLPGFIGHDHTFITASDYFPLNTEASWTYIRTENENEPFDFTVNVAGTINNDGLIYHRLSESGPWNFTDLRIEDNSVYAFSDDEEVLFLKFGVVPGTQWESGVIAGTYTRKGTFLGTGTVETPAGIFENCAHFESKVAYGETSYDSYDLWYASGVGLVKSVKIVENYGRRLEYVVDVLKAYEIP